MSHTFDSGLTDAMRTLLANKIVEKLTPLLAPGLGGAADGFIEVLAIIPFGIDSKHDVHELDLLWEMVGNRSPAVAIFPGTLRPRHHGGIGNSHGDLNVELYFVSTHRRNLVEGRLTMDAIATADDTADPGIFATVELVWARLQDLQLGLGTKFGPLVIETEGQLSTDMERTIWKQEWRVQQQRDANMYRGLSQKFLEARTSLRQSAPSDEPISARVAFASDVELPHWKAAGAIATADGSQPITPVLPAYDTNDVGVLVLAGSGANAYATPAGWTEFPNSPQAGGGAAARLHVWWKRLTAGAEVNPTIADVAGDDAKVAVIFTVRGCNPVGNPFDATAGATAAAANAVSIPGGNSTVRDGLVLLLAAHVIDTTAKQFGSLANAGLSELVERIDASTSLGNGAGLAIATGRRAEVGTFGATSGFLETASTQALAMIVLKP